MIAECQWRLVNAASEFLSVSLVIFAASIFACGNPVHWAT